MIELHFLLKDLEQKSDRLYIIKDGDARMTALLHQGAESNK